jgi:hypothetical protein
MPFGAAIDGLALVLGAATDQDWQNGTIRLPLS